VRGPSGRAQSSEGCIWWLPSAAGAADQIIARPIAIRKPEHRTNGKIHFEGDHQVHVVRVFKDKLMLDTRFQLDFNTAFATGPARPHGIESK
jgi:hypothetical protein